MTRGRLIETQADVAEGANWLAAQCPRLGLALSQTGMPPLRRRPDGFSQLLEAIISQQVSVASASAISERLRAAGMMAPAPIRAASEEDMRALGLSRQKIR